MYFLTYLDAFFPSMGVFSTKESAQSYIEKFGGNNKNFFDIVRIESNDSLSVSVSTDAPKHKYVGSGKP